MDWRDLLRWSVSPKLMARILLIDDDETLRLSVKRSLENAGHTVIEATNGQEGIDLYRETSPEIVIVDLFMPEKDGLEMIVQAVREQKGSKIIAISGRGGALLDAAKLLGAECTLEKPFTITALTTAINNLLKTTPTPTQ